MHFLVSLDNFGPLCRFLSSQHDFMCPVWIFDEYLWAEVVILAGSHFRMSLILLLSTLVWLISVLLLFCPSFCLQSYQCWSNDDLIVCKRSAAARKAANASMRATSSVRSHCNESFRLTKKMRVNVHICNDPICCMRFYGPKNCWEHRKKSLEKRPKHNSPVRDSEWNSLKMQAIIWNVSGLATARVCGKPWKAGGAAVSSEKAMAKRWWDDAEKQFCLTFYGHLKVLLSIYNPFPQWERGGRAEKGQKQWESFCPFSVLLRIDISQPIFILFKKYDFF